MTKIIKWNYNIGDIIKKDNLDIVITDRRINNCNKQEYKIKCNKCGFNSGKHIPVIKNPNRTEKNEYWIGYSNLNRLKSCPCCGNRITLVVPGINDIPTTDPWMIPYFQGGEEEAKLYTSSSSKMIYPKCPDCGEIKNKQISIHQIHGNKTISCHCKDGISFPNKFAYYTFQQIIKKVTEYKREYQPEWAKPYYYDNYFEINKNKYIVEMDGGLGHGKKKYKSTERDIEGLKRDKIKNKLAISHNIKVIRINCDTNNVDIIKNNFISGLFNIVDLSDVNWKIVIKKASSNLIKDVCKFYNKNHYSIIDMSDRFKLNKSTIIKYLKIGNMCGWCVYIDKYELSKTRYEKAIELKNKHPEITTREISNIINVDINTARRYLVKGTEEGLCVYDSDYEKIKNYKCNDERNKKNCTKIILVYTINGEYIGTFYGAKEVIKYVKNNYGVLLDASNIYAICKGNRKQTKGFIFKYKTD